MSDKILSTSEIAGAVRPKIYKNLSLVITAL